MDATDDGNSPVEPVDRICAALTGTGSVADETELNWARAHARPTPRGVRHRLRTRPVAGRRGGLRYRRRGLPDTADDGPEEATEATLHVLVECITGGQAGDLALSLSRAVRRPLVDRDEETREFDRDEFLERIAMQTDVERSDAPISCGQRSPRFASRRPARYSRTSVHKFPTSSTTSLVATPLHRMAPDLRPARVVGLGKADNHGTPPFPPAPHLSANLATPQKFDP